MIIQAKYQIAFVHTHTHTCPKQSLRKLLEEVLPKTRSLFIPPAQHQSNGIPYPPMVCRAVHPCSIGQPSCISRERNLPHRCWKGCLLSLTRHGHKYRTPSEHPHPHQKKNRLRWVVHLAAPKTGSQNGFDPPHATTGSDRNLSHHLQASCAHGSFS